jgi:hypothetical protein
MATAERQQGAAAAEEQVGALTRTGKIVFAVAVLLLLWFIIFPWVITPKHLIRLAPDGAPPLPSWIDHDASHEPEGKVMP